MVLFITVFSFIMLGSAFIASFIRPEISIILIICLLVGALGTLVFGKKYFKTALLFFAAALGFGLITINIFFDFYPALGLDGICANIIGVVTDISADGGNPVYTIKTDSVEVENAPQNITVLVSGWTDNFAECYDKVSCTVTFQVYDDFDRGDILANYSDKITVCAYTNSQIEVIGKEHSSFGYCIYLIRAKISSVIYKFFGGEHAHFIEQVLIGTRGELDSSITNSFRKSGMSHILAISGMHLVIIVGLVEKFFKAIRLNKKFRCLEMLFTVIFIAIYLFIGGLGMSLLRSGFMLIAHYTLKFFFSGSKPTENLGIAIIAVLLIDPFSACDIGFLMSVFACGAISSFAEPLAKFILGKIKIKGKIFGYFIEVFCVSTVAFLSVLPISAVVFERVSLISPISNLFAGFFAQYSLIFGVITVLLGFIPFLSFAASTFAFLASLCNIALFKIAEFFSELPFSYVEASDTWLYIWIFGSAVLILAPIILSKSFRYTKLSISMSIFILFAAILTDLIAFSGVAEITVTSLEHGIAISCSTDSGSVLIAKGVTAGDSHRIDFPGSGFNAVISFNPDSDSAEHGIILRSDPNLALVSTDDTASRYDFAQKLSDGTVLFADDAYVFVLSDSAAAIEINGIHILYIFAECDIMDIEPKFRRADILILDGLSPNDFSTLRCDYLILQKYGGYYSGTNEVIVLKNSSVSFTAYSGNLKKGSAFR